jgi:hypothetical protein
MSLGGGLEAWKGFYSSVRPAFKQLMVNVNVCTTAFYMPGNLADAMMAFRSASFGARPAAFVKGVRIRTTHLGYKKTVKTLAKFTPREYKFDSDYGKISVEEYFKRSMNPSSSSLYAFTDGLSQNTMSLSDTQTFPSLMSAAKSRTSAAANPDRTQSQPRSA